MPCLDRQLTDAQREDGFDQQRTGVMRALRPFTGEPTAENLADYLNREVFPVVKQARDKLNEVFLQVKDNAPSANPLAFYFSTNTANADPTAGFIRLDNATQDTATTIRVSESNARLVSVLTFLDLMSGSATTPLGVVTVQDAINPNRFVRFDLTSMTDQGTYWDLAVTPVESSHDNPFVEGGSVLVSFIPGVASTTAALPTVGIRAVSLATYPAAVSQSLTNATGTLVSTGTLVMQAGTAAFSARSIANVSFGFSGQSLVGQAVQVYRAGTGVFNGTDVSFLNSNGLSFGAQTTTFGALGAMPIITADYAGPRGVAGSGASTLTNGTLVFSNLNGVSFGLNGSTMSASVLQDLGLVSHVGGNVVSSVTRLAFSNASGATFSLSTAAGAATLLASVNDQSVAVVSHVGGNVVSSATRIAYSNASGVTFSLSTAGNAATLLGSVNDQSIGLVSHIGGNVVSSVTRLAFSNASNVTFSLSTAAGAATVIASVAAGGAGGVAVSASANSFSTGTVEFHTDNNATAALLENNVAFGLETNNSMTARAWVRMALNSTQVGQNASMFVMNNAEGVSWQLNNSTNASGRVVGIAVSDISVVRGITAGTTNFSKGGLSFANNTGAIWGLNGSTLTIQPFILASASNLANEVTRLAFTNGNGVTFGAATGLSAVSISASVLQDIGLVSHIGGNVVSSVTRLAFSNASNVTFSLSTAANAATLLASVAAGGGAGLTLSGLINGAGPGSFSSGEVGFNFASTRGDRSIHFYFNSNTLGASYPEPIGGFRNTVTGGGTPIGLSQCHNRPFLFEPFNDGAPLWGFDNDGRIGNWRVGHTANITGTATSQQGQSFNWTYKLGLYRLDGDTGSRLTLVNSASNTFSRASGASVQSALHGSRWIEWNQSDWSASTGLTRGQWWLAFMISQNVTNDVRGSLIVAQALNMGQGLVGANLTSNGSVRNHPFGGFFTTTTSAFPATIASSAVFTNTSASHGRLIPAVSVRPLMNAAFG